MIYSAYQEDDQRLTVDNLDKVAVEGRCIFVQKHDPYFEKAKSFVSGEPLNPTWIQGYC